MFVISLIAIINTLMMYVIIPYFTKSPKFKFFPYYMGYLITFEFLIALIFIHYYRKLKCLMERHREEEFNSIKHEL